MTEAGCPGFGRYNRAGGPSAGRSDSMAKIPNMPRGRYLLAAALATGLGIGGAPAQELAM
jgi:hypothetical protein